MLELKTRRDMEALILGATLYATGGGGDPERGLQMLVEAYVSRGKPLRIYSIDEADPDKYVVSPYDVGTVSRSAKLRKQAKVENPIAEALRIMREKLGISVGYMMPVELGGGNTAVALYAAALADVPVIDADRVGRAAPEIHQDTALLAGYKLTPAVAVTPTGDKAIILDYADIDDYEDMLRYMAVLAGTHVTVVDTPIRISEAKKAVIPGTLSKCYELGKLVLELREKGATNIPEKIAEAMGGWVVFHGRIAWAYRRDEKGFMVAEFRANGLDRYKGMKLMGWVMNEFIIVWIDFKPLVLPPDLFLMVDDKGQPILTRDLVKGIEFWGIAAPAPEVWRSSRGLELFGPRHFGLNYDYEPVEKLVKKHGLV